MKALLQPEKLFRLTMWFVAILFAWFLVGFGGLIIRDLPLTTQELTPEQFATPQMLSLKQTIDRLNTKASDKQDQRDLLQQSLNSAQNQYDTEHNNFKNWLATRAVTQQSSQNQEVIERTKRLEQLKVNQINTQDKIAVIDHEQIELSQQESQLEQQYRPLEEIANQHYEQAIFQQDLRVFGYRLLFILPLIIAAAWLFIRQRKSKYWPFVWGFIFFSLFSFFVELVPYLPSYGGYVRYIVGLILVLVCGYYGIGWMQAYLAQRQLTAKANENERRQKLDHIIAIKKLAANVCPSCERQLLETKDALSNFCMFCGLKLYRNCPKCDTRHNSFFGFCPTCGTDNQDEDKR